MGVRLNKVLRDFNVGLQTVVDFLDKKGIKVEADLNVKLTDEQYAVVKQEFGKDKMLKNEAEKLISQRQEEKKATLVVPKEEIIKTEIPKDVLPQIKPLGKVDLDKINAPVRPVQEVEPQQEEQPAEIAIVPEQPVEKKQEIEKKDEVQVANMEEPTLPKPIEEKEKVAEKKEEVVEKKEEEVPAVLQEPVKKKDFSDRIGSISKDGVFSVNRPPVITGPKVMGKIDLSAINENTHPQKKTKEEKRKEREEKYRQNGGDAHKKRNRIQGNRVDISTEVKKDNEQNRQSNKNNAGQVANKAQANKNRQQDKKRNKKQKETATRQLVSDEDVAKEVKKTLARLTNKQKAFAGSVKHRREKRDLLRANMEERLNEEESKSKILKLTEFVTANELASMMDVPVTQVIATCMSIGMMVSINQRLDAETINMVAEEFGFMTEYVSASVSEAVHEEEDNEEDLVPRDAIVTVMGHVDHGKTSLLDYIRKTHVIAGEAGGITQHIGAYNVTLESGRHITFLDTPGHEAFTAMRARGAQVTDIAIIIVAADDGVMPQTKEAINHAQAAGVPMVFAINKIDKPGANPEKIKEELAAMNLLVEDWGGKYQSQDISAKKGIGVDDLLDKVLLEADMLELKANPNRRATGSVIESSLDKGRGYVATVIVSNGTLHIGDNVIAGTCYGRVKDLTDERGKRTNNVGPAHAAIVLGLNGAPQAGDTFHVMATEQEAREIASKRLQLQREQGLRTHKLPTLDELGRRIALGDFQELNLIVKGDVDGSVEALSDSFINLSTEKIAVNVIHKGVGQITETDITLAAASQAIIIGFQVRPSAAARAEAEKQEVDIRLYSVIYDAIHDVQDAMVGMLKPVLKEEITATLEVRQVYRISKVGTVAGAFVQTGKVHRSDKARVIRDGIVKFSGEINALKRFKDDVKEVSTNFECGISLNNYNDILEGDIIETFHEVEVKQTL